MTVALPGRSRETAVEVSFPTEEYDWLERHPCRCGGAWVLVRQSLVGKMRNERGTRMTDKLEVRCGGCGRLGEFWFVVQYER